MYGVNDVFDYESDLRNPRKGGAEGALLDPALHRARRVGGVVTAAPSSCAMLWLGGTGHPWSWVVLAVSLFAVFAYSVPGLRFKERPFARLDHLEHALREPRGLRARRRRRACRPRSWSRCSRPSSCWGMASHAFGAVQDVVPDREGGIASIATGVRRRAHRAARAGPLGPRPACSCS